MSIFFFFKLNNLFNYSFAQIVYLRAPFPIFPRAYAIVHAVIYVVLLSEELGHRALDTPSNIFNFHESIISHFS